MHTWAELRCPQHADPCVSPLGTAFHLHLGICKLTDTGLPYAAVLSLPSRAAGLGSGALSLYVLTQGHREPLE